MERKQLIIQRTREIFGESLKELLDVVRQDRQELRGWEEPTHLRSVLRRAVRERTTPGTGTTQTIAEPAIAHGAGEPAKGEQREALGQILEAGATALERLMDVQTPELTPEGLFALECIDLLYGRPALLIGSAGLAQAPAFWNVLEDQSEDVELTARGVGRIELVGHPNYDWAGTGFLVGTTCLMTTRSVVQIFAERDEAGTWPFRPGISAWMNYAEDHQSPSSAAYRVNRVLGVHDHYDLALLEVEPPQPNGEIPTPLALASEAPSHLIGRPVYLVGYPVRDARRNEPETIARVFRDVYNVKRVQPGTLRGVESFRDIHLLWHDCAPLGDSAGSCLVDLETHQVLGLHISGRYMESGTAAPLWMLHGDPMLERCQVTLAQATAADLATVSSQVERLARTRRWPDLRAAIAKLYEQTFGSAKPERCGELGG